MKKRMPKLMALVLTLALCFGSVQSVFAAGTYEGVDEKDLESKVYKFMEDTKKGGYDVVKTDTLKSWIDKGDDMVIVDTMPDDSYNAGHVPTAVGSVVGHPDNYYKFENDTQKKNFKEMVESQIPNKTVWVKVSKSQYNKLAKANRKTKKVKGKTVYYKKTVGKDKDYKIVVYCGYIKCARSHTGAAYLRSLGYTNVYRYGGGIQAWKDAEYPVETTPTIACKVAKKDSGVKHWFIVSEGGSMEGKTVLTTENSTDDFYNMLTAVAGNKMWNSGSVKDFGDGVTLDELVKDGKGSADYAKFDVTVSWGGKEYKLSDIITGASHDKSGAYNGDYEIAFCGNLDNQHKAKTGCITCFGGCYMGITSGHDTPMYIKYNPKNLPAVGETVIVKYNLKQ